ncbi:hypothetical protein JW756_05635 [Candidatus Woesearchaeota archaeon]|nr:hypothetical protein [Candidatus Woesearchaeota archaeon]
MIKIKNRTLIVLILISTLLVTYIYTLLPAVLSWGPINNYQNYSVRTTVNVNESFPEIISIICNNNESITLNAGTTTNILCVINIMDFEGGDTINSTNLTFYYFANESDDPNDNNTHYTNTTCTENSTNGYNASWICGIDLLYYANNGTWTANVTVKDDMDNIDSGLTNFTINALYALNVTNPIDFGDVPVGDTSTEKTANITNFGNMDINVTIYGYGGEDEVTYAGLAMVCEQRNISISNERYSLASGAGYAAMTAVSTTPTTITDLKIIRQTDESTQVINSTYWMLHVNISTNPFGICNGTVVFSAIAP